jgi:hypothetical protein
MLRLLEDNGTPTEWELMLRREMKLKAVGCRKKVFAGLTLTPTTGKKSVIEAFSYQAYQFNFGAWPEVPNASAKRKRETKQGTAGANSSGSGAMPTSAEKSKDLQAWRGRPKRDYDTADEWHHKQHSATKAKLKKTVRPLPKQVKGPCGLCPESGEQRRLTLWDNSYELETWCNLGDFSRTGRLGFMAGAIFKCGTFIVVTDITARYVHDPEYPRLELKYGWAKYNFERATKGTDPEFPWDGSEANRPQLCSLVTRYPHRARAASYDVHDKYFTTSDDGSDSDNRPADAPSTPSRNTDDDQRPAPPTSDPIIAPSSRWERRD